MTEEEIEEKLHEDWKDDVVNGMTTCSLEDWKYIHRKKFWVTVDRTVVQSYTFEVESHYEEQAEDRALTLARDQDWALLSPDGEPEYQIQDTEEITE